MVDDSLQHSNTPALQHSTPEPTPPPRPISDSPWFWLYLFSTAALIALALATPKYGQRQAEIELEYHGRSGHALAPSGAPSRTGLPTRPSQAAPKDSWQVWDRPIISLKPLYFGLAGLTTVAWIVFWWKRRSSLSRAPLENTRTSS